MKVGDRVTLIGIPPDAIDDEELQTLSLFRACIGKTFIVTEVEYLEEVSQVVVRLEVGKAVGLEPFMHTIWVEEEYLQLEKM